jgi:uncharacterized sulfatase
MPHLPWFHQQTREYPKLQPSYQAWHRLANAGKLKGAPAIFMSDHKPREELYDLETDPHEVHNLAGSAGHQAVLKRMRTVLHDWIIETHDLGFMPESQRALRFDDAADPRSHYTIVRQSPQAYPLTRILETAGLVAAGPQAVEEQIRRLNDDDPAVRFWAAVGLLAQGDRADAAQEALTQALKDPVPSVRVVAAQTLGHLGDTDASFPVLLDALNHPEPYVSLRAANALDHLGYCIRPIVQQVLAPLKRKPDPRVFNSHYPHRVLRTIAERFEVDEQ